MIGILVFKDAIQYGLDIQTIRMFGRSGNLSLYSYQVTVECRVDDLFERRISWARVGRWAGER